MAITGEEKSWFRKREKSGSRELEKGLDFELPEKSRWFRKRDKTSPKEEKQISRQGSEKKSSKSKIIMKTDIQTRERISSQDSIDGLERKMKGDQSIPPERLRVPEPSVRRLSSPEIDNIEVITASLKIPVPLQQQVSSISFTRETESPYTENITAEEAKQRLRRDSSGSRQRTGSNDSYLGQPITGTMSFQPLTKRDGEKQSNDSVLSSSSMGVYTMSPSERNTPNSDIHCASETSSPSWLSPDSGTPGLSPPNSPPSQRRKNGRSGDQPLKAAVSLAYSPQQMQGGRTQQSVQKVREKSHKRIQQPQMQGTQLMRSRTTDALKIEESAEVGRVHCEIRNREEGTRMARIGFSQTGGGADKDSNKRYTRRRYSGQRHHTGHLPEISPRPASTESSTQLWKRWEIIASDPTEPETFV